MSRNILPLNQYDKTAYSFAIIEIQQHKEFPLIECVLKQMYQECSMRVTKVADSPMFCDKTENISIFMKKNTLSWYNFNSKGITIFHYDDKQIILLTCMRNNNHELYT